MSKVKIQGNASGTGIFTVAAPATNTDRTITLPDVDATVMTSVGGIMTGRLDHDYAGDNIRLRGTGTHRITSTSGNPTYQLASSGGAAIAFVTDGSHDYINFETHLTGVQHAVAMTIDGKGYVTTPYHPCFYAFNNQANPSIGNSYQAIVLNGTNFNIGGHFNTTNYRFTAPITGTYLFHAKVNVYSNPGVIRAWITINGSRRFTGAGFSGNISGDNDTTASLVYRLNANDYVTLEVYTGNGGNISSGETWCSLSGYLLG